MKYQVSKKRSSAFGDMVTIEIDRQMPLVTPHLLSAQSFKGDCHPDVAASDTPFVRDLLNTDGVESVGVKRYSLTVKKSPFFEWEAVLAGIMFVVQSHLDPDGVLEEVVQEEPKRLGQFEVVEELTVPAGEEVLPEGGFLAAFADADRQVGLGSHRPGRDG